MMCAPLLTPGVGAALTRATARASLAQHLLGLDALAAKLATHVDVESPGGSRGLDDAEAEARLATHGRNELPEPPRPSLILLFLKKARARAALARAAGRGLLARIPMSPVAPTVGICARRCRKRASAHMLWSCLNGMR